MRTDAAKAIFWRAGTWIGVAALVSSGCHSSSSVFTATPRGPSTVGGSRTSGPGAFAPEPGTGASVPLVPNSQITPGATLPVTKDDICVSGYSKKVRNVPEGVKQQAYANYGIAAHQPGEYEVDHLISLELGGSNSIKNLWPESYKTQPWNAHVKDKLENALHADVCDGRVDLKTAQQEIATDWIGTYKRQFGGGTPSVGSSGGGRHHSRNAAFIAPAGGNTGPAQTVSGAGGQVWVNLKSGKYFYQGSQYYGKTKQGEYLSESDAQSQGYVAAGGQSAPVQ